MVSWKSEKTVYETLHLANTTFSTMKEPINVIAHHQESHISPHNGKDDEDNCHQQQKQQLGDDGIATGVPRDRVEPTVDEEDEIDNLQIRNLKLKPKQRDRQEVHWQQSESQTGEPLDTREGTFIEKTTAESSELNDLFPNVVTSSCDEDDIDISPKSSTQEESEDHHQQSSTTVPHPPPVSDEAMSLEERVLQLETQLAAFASIVAASSNNSSTPASSLPLVPNINVGGLGSSNTPETPNTRRRRIYNIPPLESPAPITLLHDERHGRRGRGERSDSVVTLEMGNTSKVTTKESGIARSPSAISRSGSSSSSSSDRADTRDEPSTTKKTPSVTRNLSFCLLYENNEEEYGKRNKTTPDLASLTPTERTSLATMILDYNKSQQQEEEKEKEIVEKEAVQGNQQQKHQTIASAASATNGTGSTENPQGQEGLRRRRTNEQSLSSVGKDSSNVDAIATDESVRNKWLNYLNSNRYQESSSPEVDVIMEEFIKVPGEVESIMMFGFFICVDSFLYMIVILPIRFVWSCFLLILQIFYWVTQGLYKPTAAFQFHRRHCYQFIQVFILHFVYRYVLSAISLGKLYHWIRGQAMLKLYVLIAIVEVFDRLFSSLGQDCLDSMYWNTVNRPKSWRMLISVTVVMLYASLHAVMLFVHVATLNVAMNSADQALLSLLISGNFAEIKSTVFKKYNRPALFKITAHDICERFKLFLFLCLVLFVNICQGMEKGQLIDYLRICGIVWCAEWIADWLKHSFITKFNFLPSSVYKEYQLLLAGDVTGIGHEGVGLDHSHAVVKRIGFAQIPLLCVMFRLLAEAAKYAVTQEWFFWWQLRPLTLQQQHYPLASLPSATLLWVGIFGVWFLLLMIKLGLGSLLSSISMAMLRAAPEVAPLPPRNGSRSIKKKNV